MPRATHSAHIFIDCKAAFREAVLRTGERRAIWEFSAPVANVRDAFLRSLTARNRSEPSESARLSARRGAVAGGISDSLAAKAFGDRHPKRGLLD